MSIPMRHGGTDENLAPHGQLPRWGGRLGPGLRRGDGAPGGGAGEAAVRVSDWSDKGQVVSVRSYRCGRATGPFFTHRPRLRVPPARTIAHPVSMASTKATRTASKPDAGT
jgi:hypothetical protein